MHSQDIITYILIPLHDCKSSIIIRKPLAIVLKVVFTDEWNGADNPSTCLVI